MRASRAVVLGLAAAGLGAWGACDRQELERSPSLWAIEDSRGERRWRETAWDTVWTIGGPADTTVLHPAFLRSGPRGLYLYDFARSQAMAIGRDGTLLWTYGGQGQGPEEFAGVRDVRPDRRGHTWVFDPDNQRVTELDPEGRPVRRIPLEGLERGEHIQPLPGGRVAVFTNGDEAPITVVTGDGEVEDRLSLPWDEYADMWPLARQGMPVSDGDRWGYLFLFGNGWFRMTPAPEVAYPYVEHVDFPAVLVRTAPGTKRMTMAHPPVASALSAALRGDTLLVHFGGESDDQFRAVDRYSWSTGEYLDSYRLPDRVGVVAFDGALHYLYSEDPYPRITAVRRRFVEAES